MLIVLLFLISCKLSTAQVSKIIIGVDGFTCSLCAKGVEEQFKSLVFVNSVKADLKKTLFFLAFKKDSDIKLEELYDAVEDGGFSVRDIVIEGTGILKVDRNKIFIFISPNISPISLKNIPENYSDGNTVWIEGKYLDKNLDIISIKKMQ